VVPRSRRTGQPRRHPHGALGGTVIRRALWEMRTSCAKNEIDALKADLAQLKEEFASANAERRAKLQSRIDQLQARIDHQKQRAQESLQAFQARGATKREAPQEERVRRGAGPQGTREDPADVNDPARGTLVGRGPRATSCSNKQPWRFVFVRSPGMLERMLATLAPGMRREPSSQSFQGRGIQASVASA